MELMSFLILQKRDNILFLLISLLYDCLRSICVHVYFL